MPGLRLSPGTWARGGRISRVKWGGEKMISAGSLLFIVIIFHSTDATQHWFHYKYWSTSESAGGKEGKGLCVFLDQWTLSLAFKQNIHIGKLTNVVSSIGVVTQNISISAFHWISRLRSEVLEWRGLTLSGGTFCLIPSVILTEETVQVLFCLSVLVRWRLDVTINILFYTLIDGRCNPWHGYMHISSPQSWA